MSGHTPGPWFGCQLGSGVLVGPKMPSGKVGNVAVVYGGYGETAANVALIAAAPDLLAALESAVGCVRAAAVEARESLRLAEQAEFASNISAETMAELRGFAAATAQRVVTVEAILAKARAA